MARYWPYMNAPRANSLNAMPYIKYMSPMRSCIGIAAGITSNPAPIVSPPYANAAKRLNAIA